jgi:hypothetical protein
MMNWVLMSALPSDKSSVTTGLAISPCVDVAITIVLAASTEDSVEEVARG